LNIKYREAFRPFAPSVLEEHALDYFDIDSPSPYMLFVAPIKYNWRKKLPEDFENMSIWEKLYTSRSEIQPVTHVDYSARIQTVSQKTNFRFWELINEYYKLTGYPMLVNTSFNVRGEPIVCSPIDAYQCFMNTEMDYLVIGNFVYYKCDQPEWDNQLKWRKKISHD